MIIELISGRLSVLLGYPLIEYNLKLSYKGVGEQTSNGQNTAFTFSVIQLLYIFQVVHDDLIRLYHFFYLLKIPFVLKIKL